MRPSDDATWAGARVTVMGLGLFGGGVAAARFAVERGARVTVTDLRSEDQLQESLAALSGLPVRYVLGRHEEADFQTADLVIASPAVPLDSPYLDAAREAGVPLTTELLLGVERFPGRAIGVSGSNGKTTTTSLIGSILAAHDPRTAIGGNLGRPLLDQVATLDPRATLVLEISSFQLEWLGPAKWSPAIGVLTNLSPNHLDRHGSYDAYIAAKRELLAHQAPTDIAVLNARNARLAAMADDVPARVVWFDSYGRPPVGTWVEDGLVMVGLDGAPEPVLPVTDIPLPGVHNCENVLAAVAVSVAAGVPSATIADAVRAFKAVEHRLEFVRETSGVRYFNDSIATTPESAVCALRSFEPGELVLIAGGYDKKIPPDSFGYAIAAHCDSVVLVGQIAQILRESIEKHRSGEKPHIIMAGTSFRDAVKQALKMRRPGGCVLMSPGTASYDMFENFEKRGGAFKELVRSLPG